MRKTTPEPKVREDIRLREKAQERGWTAKVHHSDREKKTPANHLQFHTDAKHLWFCTLGWACADFVRTSTLGGQFSNHRYYPDLRQALDTES